jgi:hypothetical protein
MEVLERADHGAVKPTRLRCHAASRIRGGSSPRGPHTQNGNAAQIAELTIVPKRCCSPAPPNEARPAILAVASLREASGRRRNKDNIGRLATNLISISLALGGVRWLRCCDAARAIFSTVDFSPQFNCLSGWHGNQRQQT